MYFDWDMNNCSVSTGLYFYQSHASYSLTPTFQIVEAEQAKPKTIVQEQIYIFKTLEPLPFPLSHRYLSLSHQHCEYIVFGSMSNIAISPIFQAHIVSSLSFTRIECEQNKLLLFFVCFFVSAIRLFFRSDRITCSLSSVFLFVILVRFVSF